MKVRGLSASIPWHRGSMRTGPLSAGGFKRQASGLLFWEEAATVRSAISGVTFRSGSHLGSLPIRLAR